MFGVREDERRERIYRAFVGPQEDVVYLAPLYEYAVDGHSWDDASWRETGDVYSAPSGVEAAPSGVEAAPSGVEAAPSGVEAAPTGTPASAPSPPGRP